MKRSITKFGLFFLFNILALNLLTINLSFASSNLSSNNSQPIAQGYQGNSQTDPGTIVQLDPNNSNQVLLVSQNSIDRMFGVVIPANSANLTIGNTKNTSQVYVTNYGTQQVLVSNQNGPINVGDYVSISSINGVGDKATNQQSVVLGRAEAAFNGSSNVISSDQLTTSSNQKISVNIGEIPVVLNISSNPLLSSSTSNSQSLITKLSKANNHKPVSQIRVYLGIVIIVIGAIMAITILYSGVRNGLLSIGRNPLAKRTIIIDLIRLVGISILVFVISVGLAYLLIN